MTQYRKDKLVTGEVYHVYTRSIASFVIFNEKLEFERAKLLIRLYRYSSFCYKLSNFLRLSKSNQLDIVQKIQKDGLNMVEVVSFCIMPTHLHFILRQIEDEGISKFMALTLNGYSRFFNEKHRRIGPLWQGRFKSVLVTSNEQLLHLTRYIHLNPVSAGLVEKPECWDFSSYNEFLQTGSASEGLCSYGDLIDLSVAEYKKFVDDRKDYQRKISIIKHQLIEDYSG